VWSYIIYLEILPLLGDLYHLLKFSQNTFHLLRVKLPLLDDEEHLLPNSGIPPLGITEIFHADFTLNIPKSGVLPPLTKILATALSIEQLKG
jgi:hypothetical protein